MKAMYELREMLCKELDEIVEKGELTAGGLETVHKLTDTIKNIDKIMMLEEEDGEYSERGGMYSERRDSRGRYSRDGDWEARGRFGGHSYDDGGSSYANRGKHYVRGHYSREGGRKEMISEFEDMMQMATGKDREIIQRAMDELRRA